MNFWVFPLAALIPLVIGSIWYNPKVFGNTWLKAAGLNAEELQGGNMAVIFGLTYLLSIFLALGLYTIVLHQPAINSLFLTEDGFNQDGSTTMVYYEEFMARFGEKHRSFGHGALHGTIMSILVSLPIIGVISLFERRGFRYIAVHAGYWILTIMLMGGIVAQFA